MCTQGPESYFPTVLVIQESQPYLSYILSGVIYCHIMDCNDAIVLFITTIRRNQTSWLYIFPYASEDITDQDRFCHMSLTISSYKSRTNKMTYLLKKHSTYIPLASFLDVTGRSHREYCCSKLIPSISSVNVVLTACTQSATYHSYCSQLQYMLQPTLKLSQASCILNIVPCSECITCIAIITTSIGDVCVKGLGVLR